MAYSQPDTLHIPAGFDLQGHRGCRGLMPENSIPAMLYALELGVNTLELDVVISKDLQVVVSHEPFFNPDISIKPDGSSLQASEAKSYNLFKMEYAEIRKWDVGSKGNNKFPQQKKISTCKPLLAELIDSVKIFCARYNRPLPHFNIETKCQPSGDGIFHPDPETFTDLLIRVLIEKEILLITTLQSFDIRTLMWAAKNKPELKLSLLLDPLDKKSWQEQLLQSGITPDIISPHYSMINENFMQWCREKSMKVIPWTVNDVTTARKLIQFKVDGLITDYPDLFHQ